MKQAKYIYGALLLGAFLFTSPVMATAPSAESVAAGQPEITEVEQPVVDVSSEEYQDQKERAEFSRSLIVARVDGFEITYFDLVKKMNELLTKQFPKGIGNIPDDTRKAIKQDALDQLILDAAATKQAMDQGIAVAPESIDNVVEKLKQGYGGEEAFQQQYLAERGINEEQLRTKIKRNRMLRLITKREIYGKTVIAPDALQKIYDEYREAGKLRKGEKYIIKDLWMQGDASQPDTRKKAEALLAQINANDGDMGQLVLDGSFIVRRLPVLKTQYPLIHEMMAEMKVGQVSDVVEDKGQIHIFKVVELKLATDMTMEEADGFLENRLRVKAQDDRQAAWYEELRKRSKIENLLEEVEAKLLLSSPEK